MPRGETSLKPERTLKAVAGLIGLRDARERLPIAPFASRRVKLASAAARWWALST
jgi:hypothetical protein